MTPRQPAYIRLLNRLGAGLAAVGLEGPRVDAQRLLRFACWRTGLGDSGDPAALEGLHQLARSLDEEARLSQLGRFVAFFNLLNLLSVRLRLIDYRARHPQVAAQRIEKPLFITGLPRTGTTILHELIARDERCRSPATWEVTRPLPPAQRETYDVDSRIASVGRLVGMLERMAPGFQRIHAVGGALPQECVYLLSSSFHSEQFAYMFNVPSYRDWLLQQDMSEAYRWHAAFLQHMQSGFAAERWVLKTPAHLAYLDTLLAQYPDATVVWTHRAPVDALASFSSLTSTLRGGFSDAIDPLAVGRQELVQGHRVLERGMAQRAALDEGRFFDVSFSAICNDPVGAIGDLYDHLGIGFPDKVRASMRDYLARRPRDLYGEHRFTPGQFGLDRDKDGALFEQYGAAYATYLT